MQITLHTSPRGPFYAIKFERYRKNVIEKLKESVVVPGRQYDARTMSWMIPATPFAKAQIDKFTHYARHFEPIMWGDGQPEIEQKSFDIPALPSLDIEHGLKIEPYEYQKKGIARGLELKRFINGDDMGLGKTFQSIATVNIADAFPCLIVCPNVVKVNWQREWARFTDKKAMVLTDSVRSSWPFFWQTGMNQVFIVNYESLKKYFVRKINKTERWTLKDVVFNDNINLFKSIIIDEAHKCFMSDTEVLTNKGLVRIGDIVENNMTDLLVASWNFSTSTIFYNKIKNVWKNEIKGRNIHRLYANGKYLECTEDHKIYVEGSGWKKALSIRSGEGLFVLREEIFNEKTWKNNCSILFEKLCLFCHKPRSKNKTQDGPEQDKTEVEKVMFGVWKRIFIKRKRNRMFGTKVLRKELLRKMENGSTGNTNKMPIGWCKAKDEYSWQEANRKQIFTEASFREDEAEQSHEGRENKKKDEPIPSRKNVSLSWRKWTNNKGATDTIRRIKHILRKLGICNQYERYKGSIQLRSEELQSGYSLNRSENSNRGGWKDAQTEKMEISGSQKNKYLECVRLESNSILESRDYRRLDGCGVKNQFVYDLEIENDHNYFANGFLVSNCKSSATAQSKFCKGIAEGKEYIIMLTGTPVVNKPKDLIAQASIMNRLMDLGGYKYFTTRYCSGPNEASNLKELNFMLWKHCFFRREKKEVLSELPEMTRQILTVEITNRKEYEDAERDLIGYLKQYKEADDAKIATALRGEVMVRIGILRDISARGKMREAVEFVKDFLENDKKIVIFCNLHDIVDRLLAVFPGAVCITGRQNMAEKQQSIDKFVNNPKTKVVICSIKAASAGVDGLQKACSDVLFVEEPWTAADRDQAESRVHRNGLKDGATMYHMLGGRTIDQKMWQIIEEKAKISQAVMGGEDNVQTSIVDMMARMFDEKEEED